MLRKCCVTIAALVVIAGTVSGQGPRRVPVGDWPEARGPNRDGVSTETGLPEKWALNGQNFLWRAPYGGRSAPIVMGKSGCVEKPPGRGPAPSEGGVFPGARQGKSTLEYKVHIF